MNKLSIWAIGLAATLCSSIAAAAPANVTYDFNAQVGSPYQFPGIEVNGAVSGYFTTTYNELDNTYRPDSIVINIENKPKIVASGFTLQNPNEYIAHVKNVWIFRSVSVIVHADSFDAPRFGDVRVLVDYEENYASNTSTPAVMEYPLVDFPIMEPVARSSFSTIDIYRTTFEDKPVILKLNKNISRANDPASPYFMQSGIEIKATWYGHGEGSFFLPYPANADIQPFALKSDKDTLPDITNESIIIEYREGGMQNSTMIPLDILLNEAIR